MSNLTVYDLFSVEGKRALVTGGSAGMGRAMAEALVEGGAQVAIAGRSRRVFDVAEEIGAIPLHGSRLSWPASPPVGGVCPTI